MEKSKKQRIQYFDMAKGLAILAIVVGHFVPFSVPYVFLWHVPIFFLISGYFLNEKLSFKVYIKKRAKELLIPYALTVIAVLVGFLILHIFIWRDFTADFVKLAFKNYFIGGIYGAGSPEKFFSLQIPMIGAVWFLLALFVSLVFVRYVISKKQAFIIIVVVSITAWFSAQYFYLPFDIQAGLMSSFWVYLGYQAKKLDLFEKKLHPAILAVLCAISIVNIYLFSGFSVTALSFGNGMFAILGSITISYLILVFLRRIENLSHWFTRLLCFFGANSLLFLCIHLFDLDIYGSAWVFYNRLLHLTLNGPLARLLGVMITIALYTIFVLLIKGGKRIINFSKRSYQ